MDDNIDTKKILFALPLEGWKRPPGRPRTTWLKTVPNDLIFHNLRLTEAVRPNMTRNRPLWRLLERSALHTLVVQSNIDNDDDDDLLVLKKF